MRIWLPNSPETQTTVPSRAVRRWAAESAATVVVAAAVEGTAAATATAPRRRIDLRDMRAVSGPRGAVRGPQGVRLRHLPAARAVHAAAVALGRAPRALVVARGREPALLRLALALGAALRRLLVQLLRLLRRPAPLGEAVNHDDQPRAPERDLQLVAGPDLAAGLDRLAVDVHAPALDRLRGQRPGLDEPRRPQPLVDAHVAMLPRVDVVELETPHGPARAHLDLAPDATGALVLGHGAGGGIAARDLGAAARVARE